MDDQINPTQDDELEPVGSEELADEADTDDADTTSTAEQDADQPITVKIKETGELVVLRSLDEMTAGQVIILRLLMPQVNQPLVIVDENDLRVAKLVQCVDKCLSIIAPALAERNLSFAKKLDVLDLYASRTPRLYRTATTATKKKGKGKGKPAPRI